MANRGLQSRPVMKYWVATPIVLETTQYRARPLGNWKAKKANMSGIIHSIMVWVEACLGSGLGGVVIFCCTQVETPTRTGSIGVGSGLARSNQRKLLSSGKEVFAKGCQL